MPCGTLPGRRLQVTCAGRPPPPRPGRQLRQGPSRIARLQSCPPRSQRENFIAVNIATLGNKARLDGALARRCGAEMLPTTRALGMVRQQRPSHASVIPKDYNICTRYVKRDKVDASCAVRVWPSTGTARGRSCSCVSTAGNHISRNNFVYCGIDVFETIDKGRGRRNPGPHNNLFS